MDSKDRTPSPAPGLALLLALSLLTASAAFAQPGGALPGPLPLFPADNWWNADVSSAPVDSHSASYINFLVTGGVLLLAASVDAISRRRRSSAGV